MKKSFLENPDSEFSKLDQYDKQLFFEILENQPGILEQWIDSLWYDYRRKDITIDRKKFITEVNDFKEFLASSEILPHDDGKSLHS